MGLVVGGVVVGDGAAAAAAAQRNDLVGVAQFLRVEHLAHATHDVEVGLAEQPRHAVLLFQADAVLAAQHAAEVDAGLQDVVPGLEDAVDLLAVTFVVQHQRVQVAVAGMEDVGDAQAIAVADDLQARQGFGQAGAGDDAVVGVIVGRQASDGAERLLAALPQQGALGVVLGDAHGLAVVLLADVGNALRVGFHAVLDAVELDEQEGAGVQRQTGLDGRLHRLDGQVVHHFQGRRDNAGADDATYRVAGCFNRVEEGQQRLDRLRLAHDPHGDAGDDAEGALGANEQAGQVVAGGVEQRTAEMHQVAVRQHDFQAQHVVGGDAVLEGVRAAGVFRHVAADGARPLARRVRRVVEAAVRHGQRQVQVHQPRLHHGALVAVIDFQDLVHAAHLDDDAAFERQGAATQPGTGAARHERDVVPVGQLDDVHHLLGAGREDDHVGRRFVERMAVALVHQHRLRLGQQRLRRDDGRKFL